MPRYDYMIELSGTPEDVQAMLNVASKTEPGCYKKKRVNPGLCRVWYRGDNIGQPNDLVAAIKRAAGLVKSRPRKVVKNEDTE